MSIKNSGDGGNGHQTIIQWRPNWLWAFIVDEDGPTAVEYAVMLSLIVAVCLSAITTVGSNASKVFSKVASSL